jgi:polyisoprenyl-teichoic acid--peptidoglycan teichoic acid transferase
MPISNEQLKRALTRRAFAGAGALIGLVGAVAPRASLFATQATPAALDQKDAYTFLVGGLDTRTLAEDQNTDTIMISRVDLASHTVSTVSVPRDLWAVYPDGEWRKINGAYNLGLLESDHDWNVAAARFREVVELNFNLAIDAVITTDLRNMPRVVDAFGGVTVDNPYTVRDEAFPTIEYGTKTVEFPEGELRLDGHEALEYCRTRNQDGDDGRIMRQHLVLVGLLTEAQRPGIVGELPELVESGRRFVTTNIPIPIQGQLVAAVPGIDPDALAWERLAYELWGAHSDAGEWIWEADWSTLPAYVREVLSVEPRDPSLP